MSLLIQWHKTKKLGNIITQPMVSWCAAVQPCTSLFDPNKTCGWPTDVIVPGPFPAETKQLSESSLLYTPTAAETQTVVKKQKDVENSVLRRTVQRPSSEVFYKMH